MDAVVRINRGLAHYINQNVIGIKTIKAMAVEVSARKRGEEDFEELRKMREKAGRLAWPMFFFEPISLIFILAVFFFSYETPGFNLVAFGAILGGLTGICF